MGKKEWKKSLLWKAFLHPLYFFFLSALQRLCLRGSQILQTKSQTVEEAANELINMLCDEQSSKQEGEEEAEEEEDLGFEEEPEADGKPSSS